MQNENQLLNKDKNSIFHPYLRPSHTSFTAQTNTFSIPSVYILYSSSLYRTKNETRANHRPKTKASVIPRTVFVHACVCVCTIQLNSPKSMPSRAATAESEYPRAYFAEAEGERRRRESACGSEERETCREFSAVSSAVKVCGGARMFLIFVGW